MDLFENVMLLFQDGGWKMLVMWIIGGILIFLAIKKEMEPTLLLPMGFGAILINLPESGAKGVIDHLFDIGIGASVRRPEQGEQHFVANRAHNGFDSYSFSSEYSVFYDGEECSGLTRNCLSILAVNARKGLRNLITRIC